MGRAGSCVGTVLVALLLILTAGLPGCSGGSPYATAAYPVPASITLAPAPALSLEVGTNQAFTATVESSASVAITEPVFYQSSNTAVVTVAANGLACAGSWDSLSNPSVCTPGPVGTAQITATAQGVSSPPTTVYVHQHIDKVVLANICAVAQPPVPCTLPRNPCQSINQNSAPQNTVYEARAYSRGVDITSSAGQFSWQAVNSSVVTLSNTAPGLSNLVNGVSLNEVEATAKTPGLSPVFATIGTTTSVPLNFTTCPVQSIALRVTSSTATSKTITPTVTDTVGNVIMAQGSTTSVPVTWSSSQPASVSVSTSGLASGSTGGGATIIASCTPPTCNVGILPTLPIYPEAAVAMIVSNSGGTQGGSGTLFATSTGCGSTDNCISVVASVTTPANTLGTMIALPATPNSLVFNRQGSKAYFGINSGLLGSQGLMVLDTASNAMSQFTSAPGKVLAVSPDGTKVIISDTADTPNQVYVFDTTTNTPAAFGITGATAADFSPDSLKAFVVAGSTLYVYSKLDALRTIPLSAPANDVAFFAEGAFSYVAGGSSSAVTVWRTCDSGLADTIDSTKGMLATPSFIRALPDATQMLALTPPTVDVINADTGSGPTGCTPAVNDTVASLNLGVGNFVAKQLIVSQDGSTAYVVSSSLNSILVFDINSLTSSSIPLNGNALPLHASLTPDGTFLYVGASDGTVHAIQTATGVDVQQIPFPQSLCENSTGYPFGVTCNPDLIAVKP